MGGRTREEEFSAAEREQRHRDVPRRLEPVGRIQRAISPPGGGLCNLELFSRCVTREKALNVLLYGETTFHQVHGGAATSHDGYFRASQEEHWNATGEEYARPSFDFLADLGERYMRMQAVGRHMVGARTND